MGVGRGEGGREKRGRRMIRGRADRPSRVSQDRLIRGKLPGEDRTQYSLVTTHVF